MDKKGAISALNYFLIGFKAPSNARGGFVGLGWGATGVFGGALGFELVITSYNIKKQHKVIDINIKEHSVSLHWIRKILPLLLAKIK